MSRLREEIHQPACRAAGQLSWQINMRRHHRCGLIPVRVFSAGTVDAVLWLPFDEARKPNGNAHHRVSLHRLEHSSWRATRTTAVLLAPDELPGAIQALQKVHKFLIRRQSDNCGELSMFDSGLDILEALATR